MQTIFETLKTKTESFVKHYKTDFEHDKKGIETSNGCPFVHIARNYGTNIVFFRTDLSELPKKGESVPYMFGTAKREQIIKDMVCAIEYFAKQNDNYLIHYFDGKKLTKIDFKKAIDLKNAYLNRVFSTWEREDKTN